MECFKILRSLIFNMREKSLFFLLKISKLAFIARKYILFIQHDLPWWWIWCRWGNLHANRSERLESTSPWILARLFHCRKYVPLTDICILTTFAFVAEKKPIMFLIHLLVSFTALNINDNIKVWEDEFPLFKDDSADRKCRNTEKIIRHRGFNDLEL